MKFTNSILIIVFYLLIIGCDFATINQKASDSTQRVKAEEEIFYLVFPRSFYDSNGDRIGDLNGVAQKLDYIQTLGVTSIIMTPLYPSRFYHNYFTHDFEGIDEKFGTMEEYLNMVNEIHRRGMKFYMDTEMQYVTEEHPWFKDSYKNPSSPYTDYIFYKDSMNNEPYSVFGNLKSLTGYDGTFLKTANVNLYHPEVRQYVLDLYKYWMDPNQDGSFEDGVDGFRLDHVMDDLDNKGLLTSMLEEFYKPLIGQLKIMNPNLKIISEQADWRDPGYDLFEKCGIDIVYSFGHWRSKFNKEKFVKTINEQLDKTPENKYHFLFLDQHDTNRFASSWNWNLALNKQKAAMLYLSEGIPLIYYGQELGMKGTRLPDSLAKNPDELGDGVDILKREAFEWTNNDTDSGMANWFKNVQPYWDNRNNSSNDGVSVEEQDKDSSSLLSYYQKLLNFRSENSAFTSGKIQVTPNPNESVLTYCRWNKDSKFLLAFNFSNETVTTEINPETLPFEISNDAMDIVISGENSSFIRSDTDNTLTITLAEYGFLVMKLK